MYFIWNKKKKQPGFPKFRLYINRAIYPTLNFPGFPVPVIGDEFYFSPGFYFPSFYFLNCNRVCPWLNFSCISRVSRATSSETSVGIFDPLLTTAEDVTVSIHIPLVPEMDLN
jgi:hypothetical protein